MEEAVALLLCFYFFFGKRTKKNSSFCKNESFGRKDYDEFFSNVSNVYNSKFCILGFGPITILLKVLYPLADQINIVSRKKRDISGLSFFNYSEINHAVKDANFIINLLPQKNLL